MDEWLPEKPAYLCLYLDIPGQYERVIQIGGKVVGTTGFEPATSRTPSVRATRLRYVPTE
jgi:hypothetical protein